MARNAKGVLGDQFGKIGPVVARKYRNMIVYSAYQPNVTNPRSQGQVTQRRRFAAMAELSHGFGCGAKFGFVVSVQGTKYSPRNMFQKENFAAITVNVDQSIAVNYPSMKVSKGGLAPVHFSAPSYATPSSVSVQWDTDGRAQCQVTPNDEVRVVVYCPDAKAAILSEGVDLGEGSLRIDVPYFWNGLKVHVYGFARNAGSDYPIYDIRAGECSDSTYLGSGTIG